VTFAKPGNPCGTLRVILPIAIHFTNPSYDGEFLALKWGPIWPNNSLPLATHLIHVVAEPDTAAENFVGHFSWKDKTFYVYHEFLN